MVPFLLTIEQFALFLEKKLVKVNGSELYKLTFNPKVSLKDIVSCFIPAEDEISGFNLTELMAELRNKAIIRIQRWVRMKIAQKTVLKIKILIQIILNKHVKMFIFQEKKL